ncbi:MAG: hypothetical protein AB1744_13460 [Candidatus Zixiibacteriota bacterium]
MEYTLRVMHILSAVIMTTAGIYIQFIFGPLLSPVMQALISMTLVLFFLAQIEFYVRRRQAQGGK